MAKAMSRARFWWKPVYAGEVKRRVIDVGLQHGADLVAMCAGGADDRGCVTVQQLWLQQLPLVPLFIGPRWSTYSTKYFHCFNSPKNFYGDPIFSTYPDNLLSFTRICPGGKAGA